ncbi:MAG TPA: MG2 domain-containing protein, partial [Gemmataceae bacterium]|nr:MG2 domain-containing protein [Gemmataceae bacterium]
MSESFTHILDYVDDYWHDVLSPGEDKYIEEHCLRCPICKVALEEAEKRHAAFQSVPTSEASEELIQKTITGVTDLDARQQRRRRVLRRSVLPAVAACVVLLGMVHLYFLNLSPSPYDLTLRGQAQLVAGSDGSLRVRVVHHEQGQGVKDVPVSIDLVDPKADQVVHLTSFKTDEEGTGRPRFKLPDWPDGDYQLRVTARVGGTQAITRTIKLRRAWKLMLTSDRPVYQPGQDIHVRSLALRRLSMTPVAGQEAILSISDPKGNVIFKEKQTTSKFGISSVDCPLASEILEGTYTIRCQMGDTTSSLAVEVKKYVLPKFKVDVVAERPFYQPADLVKGKVHAQYFFGKPVAGARVELTSAGMSDPLVLKTDDHGEANFEFSVPRDIVKDDQTKQIELATTITDMAGQKQTKKSFLAVAAQRLRIELIPEGGTLVAEQPNTIYLYVSTPDGRPARADLSVSCLERELTTNDLGIASFSVTPQAGEICLAVKACDPNGQYNRKFVLNCGKIDNDFLLRTDRAVYNGGDTMHLTALGGGKEPIFVDLIKDGQTMLTETLPMHDGRGEAKIDLPPELFGTMQLWAYQAVGGVLVQKTRVLYVRAPSQLKI